jgi:hypothetical protein
MRFDGFVFGGDEKFITMIVMRFIVLVHEDRLGEEGTESGLAERWRVATVGGGGPIPRVIGVKESCTDPIRPRRSADPVTVLRADGP